MPVGRLSRRGPDRFLREGDGAETRPGGCARQDVVAAVPGPVSGPARAEPSLLLGSATLEGARTGHDDLGSVGLLAEHGDLGPRPAALVAPARDDAARGEGLVRPQHV